MQKKGNFKHKAIVFNLDSQDDRELLQFIESRTNNFSGYVKRILTVHKKEVEKD